MIKHTKFIIVLIFFLFNKNLQASKSASFLVSETAFNNYDYTRVIDEYSHYKNDDVKDNYLNELISAVVTEKLLIASKISNKILINDSENQEAILVQMVQAIKDNNFDKINSLRKDDNNMKNDLFEFLFYEGDRLKENTKISNSLIEIVKSSYADKNSNYPKNYNFLLFYSSLAILINKENFEAVFIKGQLLQFIEKYLFAENMFFKIPKNNELYLDAQKNIALNYSKIYNFNNSEKNILKILNNNNENYELLKILADFYRIEKKYDKAIYTYSRIIEQNKENNWYNIYLRGVCYERSGNWKKAESDFLYSLELKYDSPNVLNYLAYGWIERDIKIEKSFQMLREAYDANPESYYILDSLAWAHYKKKEYSKAAELMEKVIDMVPGEAISLDHLGDIYFAMNRKREALFYWKQAKDLSEPEDEIFYKIEKKLRVHNAS